MTESMDARLRRRIQRYGWERAAEAYARYWHGPLAGVQGDLLRLAAPAHGEAVLDVACGTGVVSIAAATAVGPTGRMLGVDLADAMVQKPGSVPRISTSGRPTSNAWTPSDSRCRTPASTSRCARSA